MRAESTAPLSKLATEQGGPVSRAQLLALGLKPAAITRRLASRELHPIFPSVYAVGHRSMTPRGWLMAAVLSGGEDAVASHRSAAWLHGLLQTSRPRHDVTIPRRRKSDVIDFHQSSLPDDEKSAVDAIPCTTVSRTLLDLTDVVPPRLVERAVEQAEIHRTLDLADLTAVLSRANGRKGTRTLRDLLERLGGSTVTHSELEERFLALVRRHRLPQPLLNQYVMDFKVDAFWPQHRLIVELDGAETHLTRTAWERDHRRDEALLAAGYLVVRFTWWRITRQPTEVVATLRQLLS
jgi:very-short-patch-repair endonuclease